MFSKSVVADQVATMSGNVAIHVCSPQESEEASCEDPVSFANQKPYVSESCG